MLARQVACGQQTYHNGLTPHEGFNWVTMLRDPEEHAYSGLKHARRYTSRNPVSVDLFMNRTANTQVRAAPYRRPPFHASV